MEKFYEKQTIFNQEQIQLLKQLYASLPMKFFGRHANLFNVERRTVPDSVSATMPLLNLLRETLSPSTTLVNNYFLRYVPDSFTGMHVDNPHSIEKTAITLIDVSSDLIGGEVVLLRQSDKNQIKPGYISCESMERMPRFPLVIKQAVGTTLVYNHGVTHGVSLVERGERIVLVSWFRKDDK